MQRLQHKSTPAEFGRYACHRDLLNSSAPFLRISRTFSIFNSREFAKISGSMCLFVIRRHARLRMSVARFKCRAWRGRLGRRGLVKTPAQFARLPIDPPKEGKDANPDGQRYHQRGVDRETRIKQEIRHNCPPVAQADPARSTDRRASDTSRKTGR